MIDLRFRGATIGQSITPGQQQQHPTKCGKTLAVANTTSKRAQIFQKTGNGQCNTATRSYGEKGTRNE
ncbi:hypothetical protein Geu3261_0160_014 [Komagataeibacter europaeus NBRC 3261]|uniref:Uncharacterized protein n=1 Tax=Komagataeibacter europaeus NBRC 3261 TaxID=1234669 RepID=A0A0D6Q1J7_KOMEU|nr:hypothetical protein Geu3261_0160_014 [Komagataeibacter europaeus NBRC 3261]